MSFTKNFFGAVKSFSLSFFVFLIALFVTFIFSNQYAYAQNAGVSIKPAITEESLDPGVTHEYVITIENLNSQEQLFYLFTRNISAVQNGGVPVFAKNDWEVTGYELADWITLPVNEVLIEAGGVKTIEVSLNVPEEATPGSHFGGVFVSVDPPEIESSGAAVAYQVANIVSIRVSGDVIEDANIRQFSTSKYFYGSQNVDFSVRIENKGNVIVKPVGPLEIYNMLGNKVGSLVFNEDLARVLPKFVKENGEVTSDGTRDFNDIHWEGDSIGFGRYEATLALVYGIEGAKKTMYSTVSFWILPMNIIGPAVVIFALFLLIVFVFVRLYIRRSLIHLNHGGRRIIRQRRRGGGSSAVLLFIVVTLTVTALFLIVLLALFA